MTGQLCELDIDAVLVNQHQPRKIFSDAELADLAASIAQVGIIQPPVVRKTKGGYELIAGERRLRAAKLAGLRRIPAIVRDDVGEQTSAQEALIENVQRVDLNPLEVAKALKELIAKFGYSQEQLAQKIGKQRSTIANMLRLLGLPTSIQASLEAGGITMGHAKVILSLDDPDKMLLLHEVIVRDELTVRAAEIRASKLAFPKRKTAPSKKEAIELQDMARQLQEHLRTKVSIVGGAKKGQLVVDYYSQEELETIVERLLQS